MGELFNNELPTKETETKMNVKSIAILMALTMLVVGCSMFQPDKQMLKINCNPQDVILKVDGDQYNCPNQISVRRDKKIQVEVYKAGYDRYTKLIDYHLSTAAKWDAVGTVCWFFPVFGFLSPGAWDLDETEISVVLNKLSQ